MEAFLWLKWITRIFLIFICLQNESNILNLIGIKKNSWYYISYETLHQQLLKEREKLRQQLEAVNLSHSLCLLLAMWQDDKQSRVCVGMKAHFNNNDDDNFSPQWY